MLAKPQMWWPGINRQHSLSRGLVGCWPIWEGAGRKIGDVINANHATLTNMDPATDWVGAPNGWALDFDGNDDRVVIDNPAILQLESGPITIVVRGFDRSGSRGIVTKGQTRGSTGTRSFDLFDTGSQFRWHGVGASAIAWAATTSTRPALNQWHQYVGVWDGSSDTNAAKLYIDGRIAAEDTPSGIALTSGKDWNIGGQASVVDTFEWDGFIDIVLIYNIALSAFEIQQLYVDPYAMFRIPSIARRHVAAAAGFVPYPRPRGLRAGMGELVGGMH
jgi:hypothetical protein